MQNKWHNITVKHSCFLELKELQKRMLIRVSVPQTIEWLINVGQKSINQSELQNDRTNRKI